MDSKLLLTDEQDHLISEIVKWFKRHESGRWYSYSGPAGAGKASPDDTQIPTPTGYRRLDELQVGDKVFNLFGEPVAVLGIYPQGIKDVYEITFDDGRTAKCGLDHLWSVFTPDGNLKTLSTEEIIGASAQTYEIPTCGVVQYQEKDIPIDPYVIGVFINNPGLDCDDLSLFANNVVIPKSIASLLDYNLVYPNEDSNMYRFQDKVDHRYIKTAELFNIAPQVYERHIPEIYLINCPRNRFLLLWGLLDNGNRQPLNIDRITYTTTSYQLKEDVVELLRSFGYRVSVVKDTSDDIYSITHETGRLPIVDVKKIGKASQRCIYVDDPLHLYLTENYIATHNTTVLRCAIDALGLEEDEYITCALTGKAALQLMRSGVPAQTIHSLIYHVIFEKVKPDPDDPESRPRMKPTFVLKDELNPRLKLIAVDEATMVNDQMRDELLSFGIPIIFIGDMNQLPPVFGVSSVMKYPKFTLTKIMRQKENDPIIMLSQRVLHDQPLYVGQYGLSDVVDSYDIDKSVLNEFDMITCTKNATRDQINNTIRFEVLHRPSIDPVYGDKIMCRQNDWGCSLNGIYLTNGLIGYATEIDRSFSYKGFFNISFRPDFMDESFEDVRLDLKYIQMDAAHRTKYGMSKFIKFEYGYAATVHTLQGSQYDSILFIDEPFWDQELTKAARYTAITRAKTRVRIVSYRPKYKPFYMT